MSKHKRLSVEDKKELTEAKRAGIRKGRSGHTHDWGSGSDRGTDCRCGAMMPVREGNNYNDRKLRVKKTNDQKKQIRRY